MKILRLLLSPLAGLLAFAGLDAAPVDSRITAVTVYPDRAVVTRTAAIALSAGTTELVFANLPQALNEQSIQVSGSGAATILDVSARQTFVERTPDPRVKELEDQLRALEKESRGLNDRGTLLNEQAAMLELVKEAVFAPPAKDVSRPEFNQLTLSLAFLTEQATRITTERAALDDQQEALQAKIAAARAQLQQLHGNPGTALKTVTVRVSAAQAGHLELALSYTVPGATWAPNYDARVASAERQVQLDYFGTVRQHTGEDWKDVALTLSTARPSLGGAAPQLGPWALDVYVPPPPAAALAEEKVELSPFQVTNEKGRGQAARTRFGDGYNDDAPVTAGFARATVDATATSAVFRIAAAANIPSDNSPQKVPVTSVTLAMTPEYATVPKLQAAAFLTAKVANSSEFPLLAGPLNVFLDGTFVTTSQLRTVMSGEKFDLALGVDEGISVKHKRVTKFTEDTGLTNSGKRLTYEYLITIQNNKKTAERVIVSDQVPLSRNEKIVVKLLSPDAKTLKPTDEGELKWTLDLKPGEKRDLPVKFIVEHPNDVSVTGLGVN